MNNVSRACHHKQARAHIQRKYADWTDVPLQTIVQLLLEAIAVRMTSGNRKMEIASLTLKVNDEQGTDNSTTTVLRTGNEDEKDPQPSQ